MCGRTLEVMQRNSSPPPEPGGMDRNSERKGILRPKSKGNAVVF